MRQLVTVWVAIVLATACGPTGREPRFDPIGDQVGYVGSTLHVELRASDPDADPLTFSFSAPQIPNLAQRARILPRGQDSSQATFEWTPQAQDVGPWIIDFVVTDGSLAVREPVNFEIKPAVGSNDSPMFVQPLGSGTELDLAMSKCIDVMIEVEDPDSSRVQVVEEPALIDGALLDYDEQRRTGTWRWCPSEAQKEARNVYILTLSADDGESPKTTKTFFITLKKPQPTGCPGTAPVITHAPVSSIMTVEAIPLRAQISDDLGVQGSPILRYSLMPPGAGVTPSTLPATLESGDRKSGTWKADLQNPVASMPSGSQVTVYYSWVAEDNDDPNGTCDHTTVLPTTGTFQMQVINNGSTGTKALCEACTADRQCAGTGNTCIRVGGGSFCGRACTGTGDGDCPTNYTCSATALTSVDGTMARQCVPKSNDCTNVVPMVCTDDVREENDTRAQAALSPGLVVATNYDLKMCPASSTTVDEDWFKLVIESDSRITLSMTGGTEMNLDLQLVDNDGVPRDLSNGATSAESVDVCLTPGTYFVHVYADTTMPKATSYRLSYTGVNTSCAPACVDDDLEEDDTFADALPLLPDLFPKDVVTDRKICSGDDDYYWLSLKKGQTLYATMLSPTPTDGDLDFHFYRGMADTTPCTDAIPCTAERGQSGDANEFATYKAEITEDGDYYLVVTGYEGAENSYEICVSLMQGQCPTAPP